LRTVDCAAHGVQLFVWTRPRAVGRHLSYEITHLPLHTGERTLPYT